MKYSGIEGKVAVVTGAAQGIGEAVARALAVQGATVAVVDRNESGCTSFAAELDAGGYHAAAYPVDVSDSMAVNQTVERIEEELGPIGVLVNVAGILRLGPVETLSDEDWQSTFSVNVNGVFYMSRAVITRMAKRRSGAIVTVGSNASGVPRTQMSAYAASKAATTMFTKCLGLEYARHHIRCNIVSPGSTDTEMQRSLWNGQSGAEAMIAGSPESFRLGIPLGRIAQPSDIADAVVFLASEQARHITMHDMCIDGGATLGC
ncbi:2,3-dihydro-2,3-dihydroxybenzoate dehydrogenase [Paenibacillus alvei]|uniref:2,3-dihydro-2,3-dihydroxybenzoate dehydrogenase n=1 Tax=Paenibacillus alvei TaxID=44250 RepID=UPI00227FFCEB|nr:2,3-dihydro-2,3-dihydroxybenzoate dehydrogenase [Paenibacillus alvei]